MKTVFVPLAAAAALLLAGCDLDAGGSGTPDEDGARLLVELGRRPVDGAAALCGVDPDPDLALVAASTSVLSVELGDPSDPRVLDQLVIGEPVGALVQANGLALAVCGEAGVAVVDANDPGRLVVRAWLPVEDVAVDAAWVGSVAVVADRERGLRVWDLATPEDPEPRAWYDLELTPGSQWVLRLAADGDVVWVLDCFAGLLAVDLSDPGAPFVAGTLPADCGDQLQSLGDLLVLEDQLPDEERLRVVDGSDPAAPQELYLRAAGLRRIDALAGNGRRLLAAGSDGSLDWLQSWRMASGGLPVLETRIGTQGPASALLWLPNASAGELFLAAEGPAGLGVYGLE